VSWRRYLRRSFWDTERARELESYLEIETDANIARGMAPRDARASAARKLGNVTRIREEIYEMNTLGLLDTAWQDLRYGLRTLGLNRGFALVAILSLALGIGANTAIFQLIDAVRMRTLPVQAPEQLFEVKVGPTPHGRTGSFRGRRPQMTLALFEQVRQKQRAFQGLAAWGPTRFNLSPDGEVRMIDGLWVSGSFFDVLAVAAQLGRTLHDADDRAGCGSTPPAVISDRFWRREFDGDPAVVGRRLSVDGRTVEIVGVTPPGFFGVEVGRPFNVALPVCAEALYNGPDSATLHQDRWWLALIGRLRTGVPEARADSELGALSRGIFEATLPTTYTALDAKDYLAFRLVAEPVATGVSGLRSAYGTPLWLLLGLAGLVLFIACANLANLLLARATARESEIAVRLALGASRWRVARQLMTESLLLAAFGTMAGLALAQPLSRFLVRFLSTDRAPLFLDLSVNWHLAAFSGGVGVLASLVFGLAPAVRATRARSGEALHSGTRAAQRGGERFGLRRALVVVQVTLSVVLVAGALLFASTLRNLLVLDAGIRQDGILMVLADFSPRKVAPGARADVARQMVDRVRSLPGVLSAAETYSAPMTDGFWNERIVARPSREAKGISNVNRVGRGYFKTMGMRLVAGRDFGPADTPGSPAVAVVTRTFATKLLGTKDPLGRVFSFEAAPGAQVIEYQVVGVVSDAKYGALREEFQPLAFLAATQDPEPGDWVRMAVRSDAQAGTLVPAIRAALAEVQPGTLLQLDTLRDSVSESLLPERLLAMLATFFGLLATVLAVVGLYGLTSYMVVRRRKELGIRMALGADQAAVVRLVLRECALLLAVAIPAGAVLAGLAARAASVLLFGVTPGAPGLVALAGVVMAAVGLAANYLPARRAGRLRPVDALRAD
jgi:putative ABC transport system permease protein